VQEKNLGFMSAPADHDSTAVPAAGHHFRPARLLPLAVVLAISVTVFAMGWHDQLSLSALVQHRDAVNAFTAEHRLPALLLFARVCALVVALSIPGGAVLTAFGGIVYGTCAGGLAALIGATAGATVIFLVAKSALGGWLVCRAGPRVEKLAAGFRADAFHY